jgi:hypothetical protein
MIRVQLPPIKTGMSFWHGMPIAFGDLEHIPRLVLFLRKSRKFARPCPRQTLLKPRDATLENLGYALGNVKLLIFTHKRRIIQKRG